MKTQIDLRIASPKFRRECYEAAFTDNLLCMRDESAPKLSLLYDRYVLTHPANCSFYSEHKQFDGLDFAIIFYKNDEIVRILLDRFDDQIENLINFALVTRVGPQSLSHYFESYQVQRDEQDYRKGKDISIPANWEYDEYISCNDTDTLRCILNCEYPTDGELPYVLSYAYQPELECYISLTIGDSELRFRYSGGFVTPDHERCVMMLGEIETYN